MLRFTIGIPDMDEIEADELLDLLFDHQLKMDFQYHHKRHENDVVMSDNRCLLHKARRLSVSVARHPPAA